MENTKDKLEIIHINIYKLFLCNLEMKYIFEDANETEIGNYNLDSFLRFAIDSIHIRFCLQAFSLISESRHEKYSIVKFVKDDLQESETTARVLEILSSPEFKQAWKKVEDLRHKCYAHNAKEEEVIKEQIKFTQVERNIITDCLTKAIIALYAEKGMDLVSFKIKNEPKIKSRLKVIEEWKAFLRQRTIDEINARKKMYIQLPQSPIVAQ
jgi:hypothetical protein